MSAEMSIAKRPGLVTRGKARVIEEFERFASEDAAEEANEKDPGSEDEKAAEKTSGLENDAVHGDEYQTVEELINNEGLSEE